MSNQNEGKPIPGHEYDGIQELDNGIPSWFQGLFAITIVFAVAYFFHYEIGNGPGSEQEYAAEVLAHKAKVAAAEAAGGGGGPSAEVLAAAFKDDSKKAAGKAVYVAKCASCHLPDGGGSIGPNLTDKFWIHGGKLEQIAATVSTGVLAKGMPAWKDLVSADELVNVVAYVKSLQGTKPANPKAAEGTEEK